MRSTERTRPNLRWAPWRSASARERPRGAVLCKRDQGNGKRARDTRGEGRRARHGVAEAGSVEEKESRDSERCEMSERSITGVLENGLRKIFP